MDEQSAFSLFPAISPHRVSPNWNPTSSLFICIAPNEQTFGCKGLHLYVAYFVKQYRIEDQHIRASRQQAAAVVATLKAKGKAKLRCSLSKSKSTTVSIKCASILIKWKRERTDRMEATERDPRSPVIPLSLHIFIHNRYLSTSVYSLLQTTYDTLA